MIRNIDTNELRRLLASSSLDRFPESSHFKSLLDEYSDIWFAASHNGVSVFSVENEPIENSVISTGCYLIIPGRDILPLGKITQFALHKTSEEQSLNVRMVIVDDSIVSHEYVFPLEISDRKEFCSMITDWSSAVDQTDPEFFE